MPYYGSEFAVGSSSGSSSGSYEVIDGDRNRTSHGALPRVLGRIWQGIAGQGGGRVPSHAIPCYSAGGVWVPPHVRRVRSGFDVSPEMREALLRGVHSKQGVIALRALRSKNLIQQLAEHLDRSGQGFGLGGGVTLHGIAPSRDESRNHGFSTWTALVTVETRNHLGRVSVDTFSVPLTDIEEPSFLKSERSNWQHLGFNAHFERLPDTVDQMPSFWVQPHEPQKKGVTTSAALFAQAFVDCRRAHLHVKQNELRRSNSEESLCSLFSDHAEPVSRGPISARPFPASLESRFPYLEDEPDMLGRERASSSFRMDAPVSRTPKAPAVRPLTKPSWLSRLGGKKNFPEPLPRRDQRPIQRPSFFDIPVFVPNPKVLTLKGARPLNEGFPVGQVAYRHKCDAGNHCGVDTLNGFFQNEVLTSAHAVKEIVDSYLGLVAAEDEPRLPGFFHPKVVADMREGQPVTISKREFFRTTNAGLRGELDFELLPEMYPPVTEVEQVEFNGNLPMLNKARVNLQWRAFFNNTQQNLPEEERLALIEQAEYITIEPKDWIAAFAGLGPDHLVKVSNDLLRTKGKSSAWKGYPEQVEQLALSLNEKTRVRQFSWLEQQFNTHKVNHLVCMRGNGMSGHYFAVVRDRNGNWLKLDALAPGKTTGPNWVDEPGFVATAEWGSLAAKLEEWGVGNLICDTNVVQKFRQGRG